MSATRHTPLMQRWARRLVIPLTLLAGAAHAAMASGIDGLSIDTVIPRLDQRNSHLPANQSPLQSLQAMLNLGDGDWTFSAQDTLGAIRISNKNGDKIAVLPVGNLLIDPDRPNGVLCYGAGFCEIAVSQIITRFNAALDDPAAFIAALRRIDPAASLRLNGDGNLLIGLGGQRYLAQIGWSVLPASGDNGFASDSNAVWWVSGGNKQLLYPTLANFDRLLTLIRRVDPTANAQGDHQGHIVLVMQGQRYTLTPGWALISTPAAHAGEDYWVDGGVLYLNYLDGTAQAVAVR